MVVRRVDLGKIAQDLLPDFDNLRNLGSSQKRWAQLFVAALVISTLTIGAVVLSDEEGIFLINASTRINGSLNVTDTIFSNNEQVAVLTDLTGGNVTVTSIIRVQNKQGTSVSPLKLMFFSGFNVGQNAPEAQLATSTDKEKHAECITSETIANNAFGSCVITGLINNVDTSAFAALAELHLGKENGDIIGNEPEDVVCLQAVGLILRSHASLGVVFTHITNECVEIPPFSDVPQSFTVENTTLFVNTSKVGIGTIVPDEELVVMGNISINASGGEGGGLITFNGSHICIVSC